MLFISEAYAQATEVATTPATAPNDNPFMNFLPLILIFVVFYIFLIRPQQKKLKEHQNLVNSVKRGDEIVTGGGIIAKISKIEEGSNIVHAEISDGVIVRINKSTIIDVVQAESKTEAAAKKETTETKKPKKKAKAPK